MTPTAHAGGACLPCSAVICICFVPLQAHTGLIRERSCYVVLRLTVEVMHRKSTMADGSKYLQYCTCIHKQKRRPIVRAKHRK